MDPQLITAIAALLASVATLIKVLQHDGIIKQTAADTKQTNGNVQQAITAAASAATAAQSAQHTIDTHLDALVSAAAAFAEHATAPPAGPLP